MITNKTFITLLFLVSTNSVFAETPASLVSDYAAEAAKATPGFTPSAKRGQSLFTNEWGVSQKMPNCTTCHGKNIKADGKHVKNASPHFPLQQIRNGLQVLRKSKNGSSAIAPKWWVVNARLPKKQILFNLSHKGFDHEMACSISPGFWFHNGIRG